MYIYEMPLIVETELARYLDMDDTWKKLAGYMKYQAFQIIEMEQTARRQGLSPTSHLLTLWGQQNHTVEELFVVLHKIKHVPAMYCIKNLIDKKYHVLIKKHLINNGRERPTSSVDENGNRPLSESVPIPVMLIEQGLSIPSYRLSNESSVPPNESTSTDITTSEEHTDKSYNCVDDDLIKRQVCAIPILKYEELRDATNNWNENNMLGKGGFGQVFKGEWKFLMVAVKKLNNNDSTNRELIREMALNQYRHDNILPLYGYSLGGPNACLVYQLMSGGSLEERLRCKTQHPPLTWLQRHRIAHGVARGLQFLHTMSGKPLIHGDIKPANILLDQCTIPKIGDFGLARQGPCEDRTHMKVTRVHGTRPYLPYEYLSSHCLSTAVDVFSYGVVLMEMASTLPAFDRSRPAVLLSDHMRTLAKGIDTATIEDRMLINTARSNPTLCREFITIGLHCTEAKRDKRPTMVDVYTKLETMDVPGRNVYQ